MDNSNFGDILVRETDRGFILKKRDELRLTWSQTRILFETAGDLRLWQERPLADFWPSPEALKGLQAKALSKAALKAVLTAVDRLRREPTDYSTFNAPKLKIQKEKAVFVGGPALKLTGRCPCPPEAEVLRCCNLRTLDAIQQCSFGCSYCSIQSFYCKGEVKFPSDLPARLESLELPKGTWHLGTGQSSDSLLYGDDYGTLSALAGFARRHPEIVLELKSKSSRTDWLGKVSFPANMVPTWSLNAPTIIENEELLTAPLGARLNAARLAADSGSPVGFHFHPMVYFRGWEDEYAAAVDRLVNLFGPDEVMTVSMGTLTFPGPVIRTLRQSPRESRILQMELTPVAGKYSYPRDVKVKMFSFLYSRFPREWKERVFFYICMEEPEIWLPSLGFEYSSNAAFEAAMKEAYFSKINSRL